MNRLILLLLTTFLLPPAVMAQYSQPIPQQAPEEQMPIRPASKMLQGGAERDSLLQPAVQAPMQSPADTAPQLPVDASQVPAASAQEPSINYQQAQMAPTYRSPMPLYAQQNSTMFMRVAVDNRGTPILPVWKTQPEEIIGHFHIDFMGIAIKQVNGPPSQRVEFSKDEKWRGNRHRPCFIWLTQVRDGSGGYYFHCIENRYGPSGWIYPIAKRGPEDKVTPWAIFFSQQ